MRKFWELPLFGGPRTVVLCWDRFKKKKLRLGGSGKVRCWCWERFFRAFLGTIFVVGEGSRGLFLVSPCGKGSFFHWMTHVLIFWSGKIPESHYVQLLIWIKLPLEFFEEFLRDPVKRLTLKFMMPGSRCWYVAAVDFFTSFAVPCHH